MAGILGKLEEIQKSIQENPKLWGSGLYVYFSLFGTLHARSYYQKFNIAFLDFVEPSNFLLIALTDEVVFSIALITFVTIVFFGSLVAWTLERMREQDKPMLQWPDEPDPRFPCFTSLNLSLAKLLLVAFPLYLAALLLYCLQRLILGSTVILTIVLLLITVLLVPSCLGKYKSRKTLEVEKSQYVRVTLSQDTAQPEIRPPISERTLLMLGATNRFHFFYEECEGAPKTENGAQCEEGRPVIIPTAKIASLEFNPQNLSDTSTPTQKPRGFCGGFEPITDFPKGKHKLDAGLDQLFNSIDCHFKNQQMLQQLMLIGRVDSTEFGNQTQKFYGSQRNLAQARAEWVQEELLKRFPTQINPKRIILLSDNYREKNDDGHAPDRSVEVWACWTPKPEPEIASVRSAR